MNLLENYQNDLIKSMSTPLLIELSNSDLENFALNCDINLDKEKTNKGIDTALLIVDSV